MDGVDPLRITALNGPWPLHDAAASRAAEQCATAGALPSALMATAGLAVARLALAIAPHATRVRVWAGPGNNGGDGLVAARHLHQAGKSVQVCLIGDAGRLPADAAQALRDALAAGVALQQNAYDMAAADLAIDALLGLGTRRAPQGALADAINALNDGAAPVLAVDIPSGLHPDTGTVIGAAAVRATATLALLSLKPGCFTHQGRDHAGAVWFSDLGVKAAQPTAWLSGAPASHPRPHAAHKGSHGDVLVIGGAPGMTGAAWLAASAALAAGAGRVYTSLLDEGVGQVVRHRLELMSQTQAWLQAPPQLSARTVVCGCGGGDAVRTALPPLLSHAGRLVLDADALNAISADPALLQLLQRRATRGLATLVTPHPLEAARLLGVPTPDVQQDRLAATSILAQRLGATVLLKGSGSIIAAPGAVPVINSTGNAALATAGTGDVLAGWAGGLWAQRPGSSAHDIATAAAWLHGRAADLFAGRCAGRPLRATDLIEAMANLT